MIRTEANGSLVSVVDIACFEHEATPDLEIFREIAQDLQDYTQQIMDTR
jgi:hypothetical protein